MPGTIPPRPPRASSPRAGAGSGCAGSCCSARCSTGAFRDDELAFLGIAALVGILASLGVVLLRLAVTMIHTSTFGIPIDEHLSIGGVDDWRLVLIVPVAGGLVIGGVAWAIRRWRPHDIVDAIEANALYGGRMSLRDSLNLALLSVLSSGVGASVGLEAAYTQFGSGLASRLAGILKLRRDDRRMLVGCGAAAAIAAAFNAPLTGAFYAFELILGSYTLSGLAPVTIAALAGTFTARWVFGADPVFTASHAVHIGGWDYAAFLMLGLLSAGLGIVVMRGVTATEGWFRRLGDFALAAPGDRRHPGRAGGAGLAAGAGQRPWRHRARPACGAGAAVHDRPGPGQDRGLGHLDRRRLQGRPVQLGPVHRQPDGRRHRHADRPADPVGAARPVGLFAGRHGQRSAPRSSARRPP